MRTAGVQVTRALNDRQQTLVVDVPQASQSRMQSQRPPVGIAPDLEHLSRGHSNSRTPAVIERVLIRNDGAERIVAAAEIHHHQAATPGALRQRDVVQKRGSRKADGERRNTVTNEFTS